MSRKANPPPASAPREDKRTVQADDADTQFLQARIGGEAKNAARIQMSKPYSTRDAKTQTV